MGRIVLAPVLHDQLNGLAHALELCDPAGHTLGRFIPETDYQHLLLAAAEAACPHSPSQLAASRLKSTGKALADILQQRGMS
jgi:hypothetical protein